MSRRRSLGRSPGRLRIGLLLLLAACLAAGVMLWTSHRRVVVLRVQQRFVDAYRNASRADGSNAERTAEGPNTSELPEATIADETRYVLATPPHAALVHAPNAVVGPTRELRFVPELPASLQDATRLLLVPHLRKSDSWTISPSMEALTEPVDGKRKVRIRVALDDVEPSSVVGVYVEGFAIAPQRVVTQTTPEVRIPRGARLEFALGIVEPTTKQSAVSFTIESLTGGKRRQLFSEVVDPAADAAQGWQDRLLSLEELAEQSTALVFTTRVLSVDPRAFTLAVWANPSLYAPVAAPSVDEPAGTNVILLSLDTLRADHLPSYGYQQDTAPFITRTFAGDGVVFDRCVAAATTTAPSHMSMFTSVSPSVHRVGTKEVLTGLPEWLVTLAEVLRAAGYKTGAVTEDGWLAIGNGFGRGFNSYREEKSANIWVPEGQIQQTFAHAKHWLQQHYDKRFFLFLHTYQVHSPYTPPAAYQHRFETDGGQPVTAASPSYVHERVAYDQEIRYTDDQVRDLFDAIKALRLQENTIVILMADHGEEFAEHGMLEHGTQLYDEVTRVPLMMWGARLPAGRRVDGTVGLIDVMPTVLEIAGVRSPPQVAGRSLAGALLRDGVVPPRPYFSEAWAPFGRRPDDNHVPAFPPGFMIQLQDRKLLRYGEESGFRYEFYDLADDPLERRNRFDGGEPAVAALRTELDDHEAASRVTVMALQANSAASPAAEGSAVTLDPAEREKLRALGYLE